MMDAPSPYFITTKRLGFRFWSEDDFNLANDLWGDLEVTKLIDARGKLSGEQVRERLLQEISIGRKYGIQYWPIFLLHNDEHIGCCGLRPYDESKGIFEIGFHLCSRHWGRGYAVEAARGAMGYAFESLHASGLFAGHNPKNEASRHILKRLGFRYTHEEFYEPTGLTHPSYLFSAGAWAGSKAKRQV